MTDELEQRTLALCRELVRIESPSGAERGVAEAVARAMTSLGYDEVRVDELGTVLALRHGTRAGPALLVDAHMDVVEATEPAAWRFPPFSAERADGRLWGRGTTDVKGSLAAAVVGVGSLPRAAIAGPVLVSASVGEERIEGLAVGHVLESPPGAGGDRLRTDRARGRTGPPRPRRRGGRGRRPRRPHLARRGPRRAPGGHPRGRHQRGVPPHRGDRAGARHDAAHRRAAGPGPQRAGRRSARCPSRAPPWSPTTPPRASTGGWCAGRRARACWPGWRRRWPGWRASRPASTRPRSPATPARRSRSRRSIPAGRSRRTRRTRGARGRRCARPGSATTPSTPPTARTR